MNAIVEFIGNLSPFERVYDGIILLIFIGLLFSLIRVNRRFMEICEQTERAFKQTKGETKVNSSGNLSQGSKTEYNREKHEPIRQDYNKQVVTYLRDVNMISILPLLGLLGTILGLIPGLVAVKGGDFEGLYSALSTALSSTVAGLVSAIILKAYVAWKPDVSANKIEMRFEEIDRLYDNAIGLKNLEES